MESGCVSPTWKPVVSETSSPSQRASLSCILAPVVLSFLNPSEFFPPVSSSLPCSFIRVLPHLTSQIISPIPESSFSSPSPERFSYFWCPLLTSTLEPDSPLSTLVTMVPLHRGVFGHLHISPASVVSGRCSQLSSFLHTPPPQLCGSKLLLRVCLPLLIHIPRRGTELDMSQSCYKKNPQRCGGERHSEIIQFYRGNKVRLNTQVAGSRRILIFFYVFYAFPQILPSFLVLLVWVVFNLSLSLVPRFPPASRKSPLGHCIDNIRQIDLKRNRPSSCGCYPTLPLSPSLTARPTMWHYILPPLSAYFFFQNYLSHASAHFTCLKFIFPAKTLIPREQKLCWLSSW